MFAIRSGFGVVLTSLCYVLPFYGVRISAEYVGIIALAAFGSAYFAEIIRAGIDAVPKGQLESARAIGMTDWQSMKNIILPQTLSIVLPPLTNQTLTLIKESAILSTITVHELTMTGLMVQGETFRPFEVFIMVALLYWALNETIATIMRRFEKNINKNRNTSSTNNSSATLKQSENNRQFQSKRILVPTEVFLQRYDV